MHSSAKPVFSAMGSSEISAMGSSETQTFSAMDSSEISATSGMVLRPKTWKARKLYATVVWAAKHDFLAAFSYPNSESFAKMWSLQCP